MLTSCVVFNIVLPELEQEMCVLCISHFLIIYFCVVKEDMLTNTKHNIENNLFEWLYLHYFALQFSGFKICGIVYIPVVGCMGKQETKCNDICTQLDSFVSFRNKYINVPYRQFVIFCSVIGRHHISLFLKSSSYCLNYNSQL